MTKTLKPKALRFTGFKPWSFDKPCSVEGVQVSISDGHTATKCAVWSNCNGSGYEFKCSCGFVTKKVLNSRKIQRHAHDVDPAAWAHPNALATPLWVINLRNAKRAFKKAEKEFHSVRRGPDFNYSINGRSAYAETARLLDATADYLKSLIRM